MECVFPPALDDKQLWAYVDGEADPKTTHHLERCEYCRQKARELVQIRNRVGSRLYRIHCPSSLKLGEYHLGLLEGSEKLVVVQHLRECQHCQSELAQLEEFMSNLAPVSENKLPEQAKVFIAQLISGTPNSVQTRMALRGESKRPLIFESNNVVITLDIQKEADGHLSILGQVAAEEQDKWIGAIVKLEQTNLPELITSVDDLGAFRFKEAHSGSVQLTITSSDGIIVQIPKVDIDN